MSKKNLNTHMPIHTHIKELLALNTLHVPVFLHQNQNQNSLLVKRQNDNTSPGGIFIFQNTTSPGGIVIFQNTTANKKYSVCMCTFANEIKTLNLFEYEQTQVNIVYLN